MKKLLSFLVVLILCCTVGACRDEEGVYNPVYPIDVPEGAMTIDMWKYYYGRTLLGWSDVYITYENCFERAYNESVIICIGNNHSSLLLEPMTKMRIGEGWCYNDSVNPGWFYQIFPSDNFHYSSVKTGTSYLNVHVDSWLYENNKIVGAKVTYNECVAKDEFLDTCFQNLKIYCQRTKDEEYRELNIPLPESTEIFYTRNKTTGSDFIAYQFRNVLRVCMYGPAEGYLDLYIRHDGCYTVRTVMVEKDSE